MTQSTTNRLLLVEDNFGDAELIRDLLDEPVLNRFEIFHHTRLKDAVSDLSINVFDVALLDLRLPDGFGISCVHEILAQAPRMPIVVLTGLDDEDLALKCLSDGAQDYLLKDELSGSSLRRAVGFALARGAERSERLRADALEHHLAAIVECSIDAIVSYDRNGVLTSWNRGAERIFQYPAALAVGRQVSDLIWSRDDGASLDAVTRSTGMPVAMETEGVRKDGQTVALSIVSFALPDHEGRDRMHAAILRDITEQKSRTDELRQRNKELVARDAQMRALTARLNSVREAERTRISREVHDELGQLLTALKLDVGEVRRKFAAEGDFRELIADRLNQADSLIARTIATVQRIAIELRPSVLDALGLSAAMRDEVRRFQKRTNVAAELKVLVEEEPPPEPSTALFRVLQELLTNIARHAGASQVKLCLRESRSGWTLTVEDDGKGMREGIDRDSLSLGLLGIRERSEILGGETKFESASGGGTLATVFIPRQS